MGKEVHFVAILDHLLLKNVLLGNFRNLKVKKNSLKNHFQDLSHLAEIVVIAMKVFRKILAKLLLDHHGAVDQMNKIVKSEEIFHKIIDHKEMVLEEGLDQMMIISHEIILEKIDRKAEDHFQIQNQDLEMTHLILNLSLDLKKIFHMKNLQISTLIKNQINLQKKITSLALLRFI